ncbi:MAG: L-proline 4-hydroxylase [Gaiellaceae bacterium]|nr:L-proline 4-hydroxylase [Gaiellaceae bacterium]
MASKMAAEYADRGYVFRESLLSTDEITVLTDELDRIVGGHEPQAGIIFETDGITPRTVFNPHLYSDVYDRLIRHPKVLGAVEDLLGEQAYAFQLGINCKAAFNGDVWFWHQDFPTYLEDDHIPEPRMVNALIFLDEVNSLNSPLMIVPGSHRLPPEVNEETTQGTSYTLRYSSTEMIKEQVAVSGIVAPTGPPGSVIFMNVNALHGSTANLSPWSRRMITLTYNAMSNKSTSPSRRSRDIVYDDTDLPALAALPDDCLVAAGR